MKRLMLITCRVIVVTAVMIGVALVAPKVSVNQSAVILDNIRTDKAHQFVGKDQMNRGSWFVEMVLPAKGG